MKNLKQGLLIVLALLAVQATAHAFQGAAGEERTKIPSTSTPKTNKPGKAGSKGVPRSSPGAGAGASAPTPTIAPALAEVIVNTGMADCTVMLDGAVRGRTNESGVLKLTAMRPGAHIVAVRRDGYHDEQRNVELFGGRSDTVNFTLSRILTVPELVANAEAAYRYGRYDTVVSACREVLAAQPDHPRANLMLGQAYYVRGQPEGTDMLWKAIASGEAATLPIKHHHTGALNVLAGRIDDLCSGSLVLRKGLIEFHSQEKPDEDFSVPVSKIIEVKNEMRKGGRLSLRVKVPKGNKESDRTYNFHAPAAVVNRPAVTCADPACGVAVDTLYALFQRLRQ